MKTSMAVLTAGVSTLFAANAALGQAASPAGTDSGAAVGATTEAADVGSEIIVTAQRRAQRLQDVPLTVSAVTGEFASQAGITSTDALAAVVPGLQVNRTTGGVSPFLRGVGSSNTGLGTSRAVALYVDDVYLNAPGANVFTLNNISQIEVSKGPQGTLFGRNATGGVIQIRTKDPGSDPGLDAHVGYGNFNTRTADLYADVEANDVLAFNLAANGSDQRDGWGTNVLTGGDIYKGHNYSVRSKMKLDTGDTKLILSADYFKSNEDFGLNQSIRQGTVTAGGGVYTGDYNNNIPVSDVAHNTEWGVSGNLTHDFGPVSLVSVSALRRSKFVFTLDQDSGPAPLVNALLPAVTNSLSQELRLQSRSSGPFTWLAGLYYYRENANYDPLTQSGAAIAGGTAIITSKQILNSYSGFADATYDLGASTRITGGLRYTKDDYSEDTRQTNAAGVATPGGTRQQADSFSKLTYRAVLDHRFSPDTLAYASYSRGFRSGGFVLTSPLAPALEPEVLDSYEVGLKNQFFDRRLTLNLSAFYYDYKNLQVAIIVGGLVSSINAAKSRNKGLDADFSWKVADGITITGGANYLDAKYTSFANGQLFLPRPATCTPTPMTLPGAPTGGDIQCAADLAGYRTPNSPKFSGNIGVVATQETSVGAFTLSGNVYHKSDSFSFSDAGGLIPNYTLVNTSLLWVSTSKTFEARVWANNVFDKLYYSSASHSTLREAVAPGAPRTYGLSLGVHF